MELYKKLLYFDIETAGKYENLESFKKNDPRGADLFIKRCKKKTSHPNREQWTGNCDELYLEKASLLPEYGQIVCVSFAYFKDDELRLVSYIGEEVTLLQKTIDVFTNLDKADLSLCGYNIKGFDNAWLIKKYFSYGLNIPNCLNLINKKPWELKMYDIAEICRAGYFDYPTLDEVSWSLGIESSKQLLSGDKVHAAYWNGEIEKIQKYCEADVKCLVNVAKKILK